MTELQGFCPSAAHLAAPSAYASAAKKGLNKGPASTVC